MSSIKERITATIESTETRMGRAFDLTIQVLIVISLSAYALETLPNLTTQEIQFLKFIEVFYVSVFTIEYLLRVWVATSRPGYIFSFYGLIDLAAILPSI